MLNIGKCPFCENGVVNVESKSVIGKKTKVYTCSNASWYSEDGDVFEMTSESTCAFRIWGNSLLRYGKRSIGTNEARMILKGEVVKVRLFSKRAKKEYFKYIALHEEYGVCVLWDEEV